MRTLILIALLGACKNTGTLQLDDTGSGIDADADGWSLAEDCDDENPAINPGADEVCDSSDNDCDGLVDDDAIDGATMYADGDGDGYGAPEPILVCGAVSGMATNGDDCDDQSAAINPGMAEVCDPDDHDEDCSGAADDDDPRVSRDSLGTWYPDADGDGYGADSPARQACEPADGEIADNTDCDDTDAGANPALGCPSRWDGEYVGDVTVDIRISSWGSSDTCRGEGSILVDGRASPALTGTFTCSFDGYFQYIFGTQTITLSADFIGEDEVAGPIQLGADITDDWTGAFSGRGRLTGAFDGTATVDNTSVSYSGTLELGG